MFLKPSQVQRRLVRAKINKLGTGSGQSASAPVASVIEGYHQKKLYPRIYKQQPCYSGVDHDRIMIGKPSRPAEDLDFTGVKFGVLPQYLVEEFKSCPMEGRQNMAAQNLRLSAAACSTDGANYNVSRSLLYLACPVEDGNLN
uniref:Uncharacterized protein n=1 Tax=Timema tahoe TaxID=61484 RepID=A0A7R9ISY6_9NEOP|nr:unnamed protein product [Timema tahoe]